jgi:hypothetical protein
MTTALPTTKIEPLSGREKKLFVELEADIEQNLKGFKKVGYALSVIRDQRLYRIDYDTFEEYCLEVWDLGRPRAYQLIDSYSVVENLSTMVDKTTSTAFEILPTNERQARPLSPLTPEQQIEVWMLVVDTAKAEGCRITADLIQRCIDTTRHDKITKTINKAKSEKPRPECALPEDVQQAFQGMLEVVQREADSNWTRVKRTEMARILREILQSIEE